MHKGAHLVLVSRDLPTICSPLQQININSWVRDPHVEQVQKGLNEGKPLPEIYEAATEAGAKATDRLIKLYGSDNKASNTSVCY